MKVPVLIQTDALECGAVCLAMILAYYGKWVPVSDIRTACGVSRDGSLGKHLLTAARSYGLVGKGRKRKPIDPDEVPLPCILHYNRNHFVVFCGYQNGKAVLNDPARGRILVPEDEFDQAFQGFLMQCVPGENFRKEGKRETPFGMISTLLHTYRKEVLFLLLSALLAAVIGILSPTLTQVFIDRVLPETNPLLMRTMTFLLIGMFLLQVVLTVTDTLTKYRINRRVSMDASVGFFRHMLTLPMEFYARRTIGDLAGRQSSNETISRAIVSQAAPIVQQAIVLVLYVIIMVLYEPILAAIGIFLSVFGLIVSLVISEKQMDVAKAQMQNEAMVRSHSVSGLQSIEAIKASGAERGFYANWSGIQAESNNQSVKMESIGAWLSVLPQFTQMVSSALIVVIGAGLIMEGAFTIGMLVAFQGFLSAFHQPVTAITQSARQIQQIRVQAERVRDVMDYPSDPKETDVITPAATAKRGSLAVKNVSFGYGRLQKEVISDISFEVGEGKSIGIAGGSGSGKSTLIGVLLGLYPRWSGEILFDGESIDTLSRADLSGYVGVIRQETMMFSGTVRDNLKLWNETVSEETMIAAAKDALIHDEIMERGGYDSEVLPKGANFSGGQRQKLELARVLALQPKILIMDEATSALDSITEKTILENLKKRGITSVVVAHRLSALRDCDEILVMKRGIIAERGTHGELMKQAGLYHQLAESDKHESN